MIKPISLRNRLALLVKEGGAVRSVGFNKQHLPSVDNRFDDIRVVDSGFLGEYLGHAPRVQENLNECKR